MTYITPDVFNITGGSDRIFAYVETVFPAFTPLMLFSIFLIIFLATYYGNRRFGATPDVWAGAATASTLTLFIAFFMNYVPGLISTYVFGVTLAVFIISVVAYFFSRTRAD